MTRSTGAAWSRRWTTSGPPATTRRPVTVGWLRLSAELRELRQRLGGPLPELVAEVEQTTGVGVEVAARADRARVGRAHLDRFLDEAASFAADADEATLGAFLAFLDAAEDRRERPGGRRGRGRRRADPGADRARGEGAGVGSGRGARAGRDRVSRPSLGPVDWTRARQLLPTPLRGDRADLPALDVAAARPRRSSPTSSSNTREAVRDRHRTEERRLAYVAVTRARSVLFASGYAWDSAKTARAALRLPGRDSRPGRDRRVVRCPPDGAANPRLCSHSGGDVAGRSPRGPAPRPGSRGGAGPSGHATSSAGVRTRRAAGRGRCPGCWPIDRIGRPDGAATSTCCWPSAPGGVGPDEHRGRPSGPAIRVAARRAPPRPRRAGPPAAPPVAGQAGPAGPPRHGLSRLARAALVGADPARRRRVAGRRRRERRRRRLPRLARQPSRPVAWAARTPHEVEVPFDMTVGPAVRAGADGRGVRRR